MLNGLRRYTSFAAIAAAIALAGASPASAAPGDIGHQDASYGSLGGSPSGSKPESKLWFNDGSWWSSMYDTASGDHHIFRLNGATDAWVDTGVALDARDSTRADVLWSPSNAKLYVSSHTFTTSGAATTAANAGRLYRYSYSGGSYTLDAGYPITINAAKSETLVIDRDSTGTLWATWTAGSRVYVNHSVGGDATWGTPYIVPGAGTTLDSDDISSLVRFGSRIGVMWSNQKDGKVYFSAHADGGGDAAWSTEVVPTGASSDDHINLKADSSGRVFAAVKTSESTKARPLMLLLVRSTGGTWTTSTFGTVADSNTRPIVLLDQQHGVVHMFATCPQPPKTSGQSGGDICEKTTSLAAPAFSPGNGAAVLREAGSPDMNDVTSTKQDVDSSTDIVIEANNATSRTYWHTRLSLGATPPPPPPPPPGAPTANFTASPTTGTAPLNVTFTDTSTGAPTSWSWSFGDGATSTAQSPTHSYTAAGTYDVSLTATNAGGSNTVTRTGLVVVSSTPPPPPPPPPGGTTTTFTPVADANVKSTSPTSKYGTAATLRVKASNGSDEIYQTYITFTVSGLSGTVSAAKLRLYTTDASPDGGTIFTTTPSWTEAALTWSNRPAIGTTPVAAIGATAAVGAWTEISLGSLVTGNGTYAIAVTSASTNSAIYASREAANRPELVVTTS
jgi:PKD repeat protein